MPAAGRGEQRVVLGDVVLASRSQYETSDGDEPGAGDDDRRERGEAVAPDRVGDRPSAPSRLRS